MIETILCRHMHTIVISFMDFSLCSEIKMCNLIWVRFSSGEPWNETCFFSLVKGDSETCVSTRRRRLRRCN